MSLFASGQILEVGSNSNLWKCAESPPLQAGCERGGGRRGKRTKTSKGVNFRKIAESLQVSREVFYFCFHFIQG